MKTKPTENEQELIKSLNEALDGVAGYLSEHGNLFPYWENAKIDNAVATLKKFDPKASSLTFF